MKTVVCTITCRCGHTLTMDRDHVPPGWWIDDQGNEVCPRHRASVVVVDRVASDDIEDATSEHSRRGHTP